MQPTKIFQDGPLMDALRHAIKVVGSQAKLGGRIGVSQQEVSRWLKRGTVPAHRCPDIEWATKGEVTKEQLRPDVFRDGPRAKESATSQATA